MEERRSDAIHDEANICSRSDNRISFARCSVQNVASGLLKDLVLEPRACTMVMSCHVVPISEMDDRHPLAFFEIDAVCCAFILQVQEKQQQLPGEQ